MIALVLSGVGPKTFDLPSWFDEPCGPHQKRIIGRGSTLHVQQQNLKNSALGGFLECSTSKWHFFGMQYDQKSGAIRNQEKILRFLPRGNRLNTMRGYDWLLISLFAKNRKYDWLSLFALVPTSTWNHMCIQIDIHTTFVRFPFRN